MDTSDIIRFIAGILVAILLGRIEQPKGSEKLIGIINAFSIVCIIWALYSLTVDLYIVEAASAPISYIALAHSVSWVWLIPACYVTATFLLLFANSKEICRAASFLIAGGYALYWYAMYTVTDIDAAVPVANRLLAAVGESIAPLLALIGSVILWNILKYREQHNLHF